MAALNGSTYACRLLGIAHLNAKKEQVSTLSSKNLVFTGS